MQIMRTIRRREVLLKTGLSASTIYNLENAGKFPRHFMLTPRCAAWAEQDIDAWLELRRAGAIRATKGPDVALRKSVRRVTA